jgi:hypothetical protein
MEPKRSLKVWIGLVSLGIVVLTGILVVGKVYSPQAEARTLLSVAYDAAAHNPSSLRDAAIVYPKYPVRSHPLVYDATGSREASVVYAHEMLTKRPFFYDATGAMLSAIQPVNGVMPVISRTVYDATGRMLEEINFPTYP